MRVTLGAPGRIMPPASKAVEFAQQAEADGFDAIWWPCHLMGWTPDSVWTEDLTALAKYQANPHEYFHPLMMMGAAGAATERIKVGVCVTDTIRRHPAQLAQEALTASHLARGRAILGLGSGERMNIEPYGMEFHKPVGRLEEAIRVIRMLWESPRRHRRLRRRLLQPQGRRARASRPTRARRRRSGSRPTARACCASAASWPTAGCRPTSSPTPTARSSAAIRASAEKAGRDPDAITPSMLAYVICAPDEETLERMCDSPLARLLFAAVDLPPETYERHGSTSPFEGGTGFHSFLPSTVTREEAMRIVDHIPGGIVREHTLCGTPEQIAEQIRAYQEVGLRDVVLWNITPFGDPDAVGLLVPRPARAARLLEGAPTPT